MTETITNEDIEWCTKANIKLPKEGYMNLAIMVEKIAKAVKELQKND